MTVPIGVANIDGYPWRDRYYNDDLATGLNDGTSEANAWQSLTDVVSGAQPGDRVNMKKTASAVVLASAVTLPAGDNTGAIWYRGYNGTIGDGVKWVAQPNGTNNFVADIGMQIVSDCSIAGSSATNYCWLIAVGDPQTLFYNCAFSNDSAGACVDSKQAVFIACTFTNTGTFSVSGFECLNLNSDGAFVGCTFQAEGDVIDIGIGDESENALILCCTVQANGANDGISLDVTFNEGAWVWIAECSLDGGNGAGSGIRVTDVNTSQESTKGMAYNAIYDWTTGIENDEAVTPEWNLILTQAMGSNTQNFLDWGNWEDLFTTVALSVAPWTGAGDFAPNATGGGGAVLRDGGTIGFIGGSGTEVVTSAFNIGGYRHGTDDGGDPDTLIPTSSASGGGIAGREIGLLPVTKTSEIA